MKVVSILVRLGDGHQFSLAVQFAHKKDAGWFAVLVEAVWYADSGVTGKGSGPGVAAAVPLAGQLSGALSQRMTLNNARMANAIVRAGKNGSKIATAYIRSTPKSDRSASELAELLLKNKVPVEALSLTKSKPLLADAAILAAVAMQNDKEE